MDCVDHFLGNFGQFLSFLHAFTVFRGEIIPNTRVSVCLFVRGEGRGKGEGGRSISQVFVLIGMEKVTQHVHSINL